MKKRLNFSTFQKFSEKNDFRKIEKIVKFRYLINKIKKINFDEILISQDNFTRNKVFNKKLTDKNTKVGFYYPRSLDRDLYMSMKI